MERYKVELLPKHDARPDQEYDGYLAWMGRIIDYTEKDAIYKAHIIGGRAEKVQPEKMRSISKLWLSTLIRWALTPVIGLFAERYYYKYLKDAAMSYMATVQFPFDTSESELTIENDRDNTGEIKFK